MKGATWARVAACVAASLLAARVGADPAGPSESFGPQIMHLPVLERHAEQGILRPVPISAELPSDVATRARRVLLHYRLWGEPDWTTLQLRPTRGTRFDGAIPCLEISTVTGDLRYYIRVHDPEGQVIAQAGSRAKPFVVTIKHDTTLGADASRVAKCPDPADCPRGLPGCPSEQVQIECRSDRDCEGGMTCSFGGFCERTDRRRTWISLSAQQDFGIVTATGACSVVAQENEGYACYRTDGEQYLGSPVLTNEPLAVGRGPTRGVLGLEHLVHYDTSLGVRVGWAFAGEGPTPRGATAFVPLSVSLRATHWFGSDPLARSGLRPFAFLTGGYAASDIKAKVRVREDPRVSPRQSSNDLEQQLVLWKRAGDAFVGVGAGITFAWSVRQAAFVEVIAVESFPFGAFVVAPSAGVQLAF